MDGVEQGATRADLFRPDLSKLKISDGYSGFRFAFTTALDPFREHVVEVEDRDSGRSFGPPPVVYKQVVRRGRCAVRGRPRLRGGECRVGELRARSYRAARRTVRPRRRVRACPRAPTRRSSCMHKAEIPHRYYETLGIGAMRVRLAVRPRDGVDTVAFNYPEAAGLDDGGQAVSANLIPARLPDYLSDVGKENMERVSGPGEVAGRFAACGLATAYRIDRLVRLNFGRGLEDCGRCLDWGAGPGRVALPMARIVAPGLELTAVDVDGFNVAFGKTHFPDIDYAEAPFMPPLPYPDATFGAIYGVSVFTHLTESVQFAWLAELRRLAKPGAPVVVSVHNDFVAFHTAQGSPQVVAEFETRGISDGMHDDNLGPKLKEKSYYRATFHSRRYILENWTREFEILKIYTCANGATQDFVVMRPK